MGKVRRGNFIFIWYIGDHSPPHIHIYRNNRLIAKWDLQNKRAMTGLVGSSLRKIIDTLESEGSFHEIYKN